MSPPPKNPGLLASAPNTAYILVPFFLASLTLALCLLCRPLRKLLQLFHALPRRPGTNNDGRSALLRDMSSEEMDVESACHLSELQPLAAAPPPRGPTLRLRPLRRPEPLSADLPRYVYCTDPNCEDDDKASLLSPELDLYFDPGQPGVARYHSTHRGRRSITYEEAEEREASGWEVLTGRKPGTERGRVEGTLSRKVEQVADGIVDWAVKMGDDDMPHKGQIEGRDESGTIR